ncbi:MAG: corA [Hyphomicrobiales bacterium]|nr:corA [Hyphomicrobiales bacterium]
MLAREVNKAGNPLMLRIYVRDNDHLTPHDVTLPLDAAATPIDAPIPWIDLFNPTPTEDRFVEEKIGISIPTREEMQEIEVSARLYNEDGAEFMTMTGLIQLDTDEPATTPITFILKGSTLVTVRYAEPRPFLNYSIRAQRPGIVPCTTGEQIMMGILEALIDRIADALERVGVKIDAISREVFRNENHHGRTSKTRDLQRVIESIGREGDLLGLVRESLVSINRLATYHTAVFEEDKKANKDARVRLRILQRDVASLSDHSSYMSGKIQFMLDATLGLINLEQNQIIKIFSIAAVCLMPPTLVASVYGMNFKHMPELDWDYGYPMSLIMMIVAAILPYLYFKRRGWL